MPANNPIAQKWQHLWTTGPLTPVTVQLNESVLAALDRFCAVDSGVGRPLDREMAVAWLVTDGLGLNRPVPFIPIPSEKGPR